MAGVGRGQPGDSPPYRHSGVKSSNTSGPEDGGGSQLGSPWPSGTSLCADLCPTTRRGLEVEPSVTVSPPPGPPAQRSGAPAPRGHLHTHHLRAWKSSLCTWGPGPSGVFPACAPTLLTGHVTSATQPPGLCTRPCPAGSVPQSEVCGVPAAPTEGKRQKDSFRHFSLKIPNPAHVATGSPIRGEWSQLEEETARPLRLGLQGTPPPPGADWPPARSSVAPQEEDLPRALPAPPQPQAVVPAPPRRPRPSGGGPALPA